jgi:hypothetical protein
LHPELENLHVVFDEADVSLVRVGNEPYDTVWKTSFDA